MSPTRHLCLVSAEPTPNITPVLDNALKPDEVILLVSSSMKKRAGFLKNCLQPSGVKVWEWPIDDAWDTEHIQEGVLALLSDQGEQGFMLNATGGTKPMSIAAYEVFRGLDLPIFYVHIEKGRVVWMHPKERAAVELENRIRLKQFFRAHGVEMQALQRQSVPQAWKQLTEDLIADMQFYGQALGSVNYMAAQARGCLRASFPKGKENWKALQDLLALFETAGLLYRENKQVVFSSEKSRFFVNGGWLEQHVLDVLQKLRKQHPRIHDVGQGVVVRRGDVQNELDVVFLCDNSLYVIECKTKQFKAEGAEALYKLDSLVPDLGGLRAKAMLISFQQFGVANQERAKKNDVCLCVAQQLRRLDQHLLRWIG